MCSVEGLVMRISMHSDNYAPGLSRTEIDPRGLCWSRDAVVWEFGVYLTPWLLLAALVGLLPLGKHKKFSGLLPQLSFYCNDLEALSSSSNYEFIWLDLPGFYPGTGKNGETWIHWWTWFHKGPVLSWSQRRGLRYTLHLHYETCLIKGASVLSLYARPLRLVKEM